MHKLTWTWIAVQSARKLHLVWQVCQVWAQMGCITRPKSSILSRPNPSSAGSRCSASWHTPCSRSPRARQFAEISLLASWKQHWSEGMGWKESSSSSSSPSSSSSSLALLLCLLWWWGWGCEVGAWRWRFGHQWPWINHPSCWSSMRYSSLPSGTSRTLHACTSHCIHSGLSQCSFGIASCGTNSHFPSACACAITQILANRHKLKLSWLNDLSYGHLYRTLDWGWSQASHERTVHGTAKTAPGHPSYTGLDERSGIAGQRHRCLSLIDWL